MFSTSTSYIRPTILSTLTRHTGNPQNRGQQTFSVKGQLVNSLGFAGHIISAAATQLCLCGAKAVTDNTQ